jgi:hypothetical protein
MTMFLTRDQIAELTGYKMPSKQIFWLTRNGVRHWVAATGWPVVPCSAIDGASKRQDDLPPFEIGHVA